MKTKNIEKAHIRYPVRPVHRNENPIYVPVFLFWEFRGLSHNFYFHVSVSDLLIPRICPHISCTIQADRSWEYINRSQTHERGNWDCVRAISVLVLCSLGTLLLMYVAM